MQEHWAGRRICRRDVKETCFGQGPITRRRSGPEKANLGRHAGMLCGCGWSVAERSRIDGYETDESSHSKQETI